MNPRQQAFTLIELLIVVAIIAILAAIAVPNFLEAQVRSKVSRVNADQRTLATAMESYYVDNNAYVPEYLYNGYPELVRVSKALSHLTTPIAYVTSIPPDVFTPKERWASDRGQQLYWYYNWLERHGHMINVNGPDFYNGSIPWYDGPTAWILTSLGPDREPNFPAIYDPTNGTVSRGDISRLGPGGGGQN